MQDAKVAEKDRGIMEDKRAKWIEERVANITTTSAEDISCARERLAREYDELEASAHPAPDKANDPIVDALKIHSIKNYGAFVFVTWNRDIEDRHVKMLADSMAKESPTIAYTQPATVRLVAGKKIGDDNSLLVIDGQHRIKAWEMLGRPIYCVVAKQGDMTAEIVTRMNSQQKKWSTNDYIQSMVARNKQPYIWYKDLIEKYGLSDSFYRMMYSPGFLREGDVEHHIVMSSRQCDNDFKNGKFDPSDDAKRLTRLFCSDLDEICQATNNKKMRKALRHGNMVRAFAILRRHPDFKLQNMVQGIEKYGQLFSLKYMIVDNVDELVAIYNYKRRNGKISISWNEANRTWIYA